MSMEETGNEASKSLCCALSFATNGQHFNIAELLIKAGGNYSNFSATEIERISAGFLHEVRGTDGLQKKAETLHVLLINPTYCKYIQRFWNLITKVLFNVQPSGGKHPAQRNSARTDTLKTEQNEKEWMSYNNSEHVSNSLSSRELTPVITHVYNIQHAETVASDCQVITGHVLYHTRNIHWSCGRKDTMKPPTVAYTKEKGKMDGDNKRRTTPSTRQIKQMSGDNSRPTTPSTSQIKQMGGDNSTRTTPSTSQIKQMGGDNSTRTTPSTSQIKQMGGDNSTRTTPSPSQIKQMGGDNSTRTTPSTSQIKQMGGDNSTRTTPSTSQANLRHQKVPLQDLVKECEVVDSAHQRRDNITKGKERGKKRMRVVSSVADVHELNGNECTVHKKRRTYVKQLL